jgi:heme/copper-type cytochrome/quinol oxidase subunit 3
VTLAIHDDSIGVEPVAPALPGRRNVMLVGSILAAAAGTVLLGAVLGDYLHARDVARAAGDPWPPEGTVLPNVALLVTYSGLLLSSFFAQWTLAAIKMDDRKQAYIATSLTVLMGLLFINGLTFCWVELGQAAGSSSYATGMYAVSVMHLLMVVAAIAMWVIVAFRVFGGQFDAENTEPIKAALVIWHFVVIAGAVVWWALWFLEGGPG